MKLCWQAGQNQNVMHIAEKIGRDRIKTARVDADNVPELVKLITVF